MGLVRTKLLLSNPKRPDLVPVEVDAPVDTGAVHLCIPKRVAIQLELDQLEKREVTVADGSTHSVPYMGPILTAFGRRHCYTGAMVLGDEVLLGHPDGGHGPRRSAAHAGGHAEPAQPEHSCLDRDGKSASRTISSRSVQDNH